ncbi:CHAT domain-containing protein [Truncatella angustata]|uniref:CHAT domain-containing protein n=1 Tax=Truncatella angustata TaxID=152316 RepID=A0A9P8RIE8_9PEZI|nr:CHAT domain-containing protein [Truncatella angustata]KAH6646613.1 CHAT domain-containing protein [Truncatella angustata]
MEISEETSIISQLNDRIETARQAVDATSRNHSELALRLSDLGIQLGERFDKEGAIGDLEAAINAIRQAVEATPQNHLNRAALLNSLGIFLVLRYNTIGFVADLETAIETARQAVSITPQNHPNRAIYLGNLGNHLGDRFNRTGAIVDIEEVIEIARQAVNATPQDHPNWAIHMTNLGNHLGDKFNRTGAIADLEAAIDATRQAIDTIPQDHPDTADFLNNHGESLRNRFDMTGDVADLEEAINLTRQAVITTPQGHRNRAVYLSNFGIALGVRFDRTGAIADLEAAISAERQAVNVTPKDHTDYARYLNNLGEVLRKRFSRTGAMADLEEAINTTCRAVSASRDHLDRALYLCNLGIQFGNRFSRTRAMIDLEEAIKITRLAVDATPQDHPNWAFYLGNLGNYLGDKFGKTGAIANLEEAIKATCLAIDTIPQDHPAYTFELSNLGNRLMAKFKRTEAPADLMEAIETARQAVDAAPQDHPNLAIYLNNLGSHLRDKFDRTQDTADLEASYRHFVNALSQHTAPISQRVIAGRRLLSSDWAFQDTPDIEGYARTALELLPQLTPHSLQNADKQHLLLQAAGLASDAAAIALLMQQAPATVVQWLEMGRGVLVSGLQDLRTDMSILSQKYPRLSDSFNNWRAILDAPAEADAPVEAKGAIFQKAYKLRMQSETDKRRHAYEQLQRTIHEIRKQPGFDRFLLSPAKNELLQAAENGPVIIINISRHRSDALIVLKTTIQCLELPNMRYQDIKKYRQALSLPSSAMLEWLWDCVVDPILNHLSFSQTISEEPWPRVWWIPIGPLVGFPLHAAGYHLENQGRTTIDRVVSSYATSLRSMIHTRLQPWLKQAMSNLVVVAMEYTRNKSQLKYASKEIEAIKTIGELVKIKPIFPEKRKSAVQLALEDCEIFHFAGHGSTHPVQPLQSQLLLDDWEDDPFTVGSLLQINLSRRMPFLAYLSACGTSQILDEQSADESIHLSSACQLAGFRHVIGTLWSVDDELCVKMATPIYNTLAKEGLCDESVSYGLHLASRQLRDEWVQSMIWEKGNGRNEASNGQDSSRDIEFTMEPEFNRLLWVPYVHYGV